MNRFALLIATLLCCALVAMAAPIDGTWAATSGQGAPVSLNLISSGGILAGTADGVQISNGKVEGALVWFTAVRSGVSYTYKGSISGTVLKLTETRADGTGLRNLQFNHQ